jgi:hypothetical protein
MNPKKHFQTSISVWGQTSAAVAQIIIKLFLKSYNSKRHTGQGNIKKHSLGHDRISKKHNLDLGNSPFVNISFSSL